MAEANPMVAQRGTFIVGVFAGTGTDKRGRSQLHVVTDSPEWPERLNLNFQFNPLTGEVILPADLVSGRDVVAVEVSQEAVNFGGGFVASSVLSITRLGTVGVPAARAAA
jgi:hypothetical protein